MDEQEIKETAESILREMPGVVGAFVQPDAFGKPREVHLLIRPGPRPREFAQHVRSVLESRLRIPIDQRIISIAQLAAEPSPGVAEVRREPQQEAGLGRLQLVSVESEVAGTRILAGVRLRHLDQEVTGQAVEIEAQDGRCRAAAFASLNAINQLIGEQARFGLDFATVVEAVGGAYALSSLVASSRHLGRRTVSLSGAIRVEEDVETASALATLKATNRVVGYVLGRSDRRLRFPRTPR
jgi:hypothetical protein